MSTHGSDSEAPTSPPSRPASTLDTQRPLSSAAGESMPPSSRAETFAGTGTQEAPSVQSNVAFSVQSNPNTDKSSIRATDDTWIPESTRELLYKFLNDPVQIQKTLALRSERAELEKELLEWLNSDGQVKKIRCQQKPKKASNIREEIG